MKTGKKNLLPIIFLVIFETVAVTLWLTKNNLFYLLNFSYIGISISLGIFLFTRKNKHARRVTQLLVGTYMLIYLGLISGENMQIEGFWYYLFTGVFEAATIHYAVAKIFGPLIFGRGWCGFACWTAMILDFLPYKTPNKPRKKIGWIRYITFAVSLIFVTALFLAKAGNIERIMFWAFIIGNVLYYAFGIVLAFLFKDNRAFCKYICPITVFLKPMSYFSLIRIKCDTKKCVSCGKCSKVCPMDVDVTDNSRKRKNGTECILSMNVLSIVQRTHFEEDFIMNELCMIIKDMVKPNFLNIRTSIQTYDRDAICCGAPCWRWAYHALHSADKWFINPCVYNEPSFHEEGLDNPDKPASVVLSDDQLLDYLDSVEQKTYAYLDSLTDEMLYECPENCEHTRLELVLRQFRHISFHTGMLNGQTAVTTGKFPMWVSQSDKYVDDGILFGRYRKGQVTK